MPTLNGRLAVLSISLLAAAPSFSAGVPGNAPLAGKTVTTFTSEALITAPPDVPGASETPVAKIAPAVDFIPIPPPDGIRGSWHNLGDICLASNGRLYLGLGNNGDADGRTYLYEFDPAAQTLRQVADLRAALHLEDGVDSDGKIHGGIEEGRDGWLYFATFWSNRPPKPRDDGRYLSGQWFRYHPATETLEPLGNPCPGDSWPNFRLDPERGIAVALGQGGNFLAYNIHTRRPLHCGPTTVGAPWNARASLLDPRTGKWYGSCRGSVIEFDPADATFRLLDLPMPPAPGNSRGGNMRAHVSRDDGSGGFHVLSDDGVLFRFLPETERIEVLGLNWADGQYATDLERSPGGRYLYYAIGARGNAAALGAPVIQFDTRTATRKVLAYLQPAFFAECRYTFGSAFGLALSPDGSALYCYYNGVFQEASGDGGTGDAALIVLHIPEAERPE